MAAVIQGILKESRDYYRALKRELVSRLLVNMNGTLITKSIHGSEYAYLRRRGGNKRIDTYLGRMDKNIHGAVSAALLQRKKDILALRSAKLAMKELHIDHQEIVTENYLGSLRDLFQRFADEGLWDDGLQVIGSWCFKIYQSNFGVEFYPERTQDVDVAVRIPFSGKSVNIAEILKSMGFEERFDYLSGLRIYRCDDFIVEFLEDRQGNGRKRRQHDAEEALGVTTQALPYLKILLDNPTVLAARDLGKVCVPSMPAFVVHKLIVAASRRDTAKIRKDYRQVESVCKTICWNPGDIEELGRIARGMHKTWQSKMLRSFAAMGDHVRREPQATGQALAAAGLLPASQSS